METREINRLRQKFIAIALASVLIVMLFIGGVAVGLLHLYSSVQIHTALDAIGTRYERGISGGGEKKGTDSSGESGNSSRNADSSSSDSSSGTDGIDPSETLENKPLYGFNLLSPRLLSVSSFFTVEMTEDKTSIRINTVNLDSLEDTNAYALALQALERGGHYGNIGIYYYAITTLSNGNTLVAMLNNQENTYMELSISILITGLCMIGLFITFFIIRALSYRAIQPSIENATRQKEFITNASHELKTPLAVISANTEFIEMMNGKSEWTESTLNQVDRMNGLIQNLVMISRSSEQESTISSECNVSKAVQETVEPFEALAKREEKDLAVNITPGVTMITDESAIRMLSSTLVDNAIKYCDEKGMIGISLIPTKKKNTCILTVSNSYADGANIDCRRFFDRFYREDQSHHTEGGKKGYGIGLSVAESIANRNGGSIRVDWKDGIIAFTAYLVGSRTPFTGDEAERARAFGGRAGHADTK